MVISWQGSSNFTSEERLLILSKTVSCNVPSFFHNGSIIAKARAKSENRLISLLFLEKLLLKDEKGGRKTRPAFATVSSERTTLYSTFSFMERFEHHLQRKAVVYFVVISIMVKVEVRETLPSCVSLSQPTRAMCSLFSTDILYGSRQKSVFPQESNWPAYITETVFVLPFAKRHSRPGWQAKQSMTNEKFLSNSRTKRSHWTVYFTAFSLIDQLICCWGSAMTTDIYVGACVTRIDHAPSFCG